MELSATQPGATQPGGTQSRDGVTYWQESPRSAREHWGEKGRAALRLEAVRSWPSGFVNLTYSREPVDGS